jgi:superfamily II DNA helicase RecQ
MRIKLFTAPVLESDQGEQEINTFCAAHAVVTVDKHFVADGANSFWAFCITWRSKESSSALVGGGGKTAKVDYRAVLNDRDFQLFVKLRELRKIIADSEGVPAYALFTNEQLATMVTKQIATKTGLAGIEGVGAARIEKYGTRFLEAPCQPISGLTQP